MIGVPFVYFMILSILFYIKKNKVDLSVIISLIYAISGFFSILIERYDIKSSDLYNYNISFEATFVYCFLLTICICAISNYNTSNLQLSLDLSKMVILKRIAVIVFICFVLMVVISFSDLIKVFTSDISSIRVDIATGEYVSWISRVPPGPIRFLFAFCNILFNCSWIFLFFAFYMFSFPQIPIIYPILLFITSLSGPYSGVLSADRSQTAYWIISLFTNIFVFRPYMPRKVKKILFLLVLLLLFILIFYLSMITISRFNSNVDNTIKNSIISYLGQSYINFCFFYDNYRLPYVHYGILFPLISTYIYDVPAGGTAIQADMSLLSGYFTGVFYTFMGHLIIALGQFRAIVVTLIYAMVSFVVIKKIKKRKTDIVSMYIYYFLASILFLGLFTYYYAGLGRLFSVVFFLIILKYSNLKIKR